MSILGSEMERTVPEMIDTQSQLTMSLLSGQMKERLKKSIHPISHLTVFLLLLPFLPLLEASTLEILLILQPQGICLAESLLATAIWISVRSYYPLKQGSPTILAQVPQKWNKLCQRHQNGQRNIFPIFTMASPTPIGILTLHWAFLEDL